MKSKIENYVVRPNKALGDWAYEYSGNVGRCNCECNDKLADITNAITNLNGSIQSIQSSLEGTSVSEPTVQQITTIVNNKVTERIDDILTQLNELTTLVDSVQPQNITNNITNITNDLTEVKRWIQENSSKVENVSQYITQLSGVTDRLSTIETQLATLSADAIKQAVLDSLTDELSTDMSGIVTEIINDRFSDINTQLNTLNTTVGTLGTNVESAVNALNNHISNTDIHVTAADKNRWNTAVQGGLSIIVEDKTLIIS